MMLVNILIKLYMWIKTIITYGVNEQIRIFMANAAIDMKRI